LRRRAFLKEAIEVHRAYEQATDTLRQLLRENKAYSPEWDEVIAHQQQLLAAWSVGADAILTHVTDFS
jgi:hypothetical protein